MNSAAPGKVMLVLQMWRCSCYLSSLHSYNPRIFYTLISDPYTVNKKIIIKSLHWSHWLFRTRTRFFFLQKQHLNTAISLYTWQKILRTPQLSKELFYVSTLRQLFYKYNNSFCKGDVGRFYYQVEFGRLGQNIGYFFF